MIEMTFGRTELRLDFSFFAAAAFFLMFGKARLCALAFAFCAVHELSHLTVMALCGVEVQSVTFCGAGIGITARELERERLSVQAAVLAAGSAANILLAAALFLLECREPAALCLITGAINLLPAGALDGARLLRLAVLKCAAPERVDGICRAIGIITLAVCAGSLAAFSGRLGMWAVGAAAYFLLINVIKP